MDTRRRSLMRGSVASLVFGLAVPVSGASLILTPSQSAGPFYPLELPLDVDNDLVRVADSSGLASGEITNVVGTVMDQHGKPASGAMVEIWQCDAYGRYHHVGDNRSRQDPHFQGYGSTMTDNSGRYRFRTIKPVSYPRRAPHIHFKVSTREGVILVTQLYVAGDPSNPTDVLLRQIKSPEERDSIIAPFQPAGDGLIARFDIVISATG